MIGENYTFTGRVPIESFSLPGEGWKRSSWYLVQRVAAMMSKCLVLISPFLMKKQLMRRKK